MTLFHGPKVRYRGISHDWRTLWPNAFDLGLHTIDFGRAVLGAWLLVESLARAPATGLMRHSILITHAAILIAAVILQITFRAKPDTVHAPFTFVAGLVLGFYPPAIAAYALLLALVATLGTKALSVFFPVLGLALAAVGTVFVKKFTLTLAVGVLVVTLPWLWSLLFGCEMMASYRARRASDDSISKSPSRT